LPSIRSLHKRTNLSISTVYKAYVELESMGLIEARPKSGYFVYTKPKMKLPEMIKAEPVIREINFSSIVISTLKDLNDPNMLHLGSSATSHELLPVKHLTRIIKNINAEKMKSLITYPLIDGDPELKRQLALLFMGSMESLEPNNIVITNGCMEAITISLLVFTKAGDTVLIESPAHFGFLQLLKELSLNVVEVPVNPLTGIDIDEFKKVLDLKKVKACLIMSNFQNPTGALMPGANKQKLVDIATEYNVPIIEDNLLSELYYDGVRPSSLKKYDTHNNVISCSSFSKTIAPGLRTGWLVTPKKFRDKILSIKSGISISSPSLNQHIIAEFLKSGAYDRFMRSLRGKLKKQSLMIAQAVQRYFPKGTRVSVPKGGSLLWIQLEDRVNGVELYKTARGKNISIIPGEVCSSSGQFKNYIRLGCGSLYNHEMEQGIKILGKAVSK
ncbi:MAG: PLP-dependent aminotransferase family protein, partial [Desulfobacteraceae bacterium]|nr:PLP-dependent aminotransferase family protein [Desulfobacteraceae bacterium]